MKNITVKLACVVLALSASQLTLAAESKTVEPVSLSSHSSFHNNLKTFTGKSVVLVLNNGAKVKGKVKSLSKGIVHIEMLGNKSFYDAVVKINDISAIQAKVRK